MLEIQTKWTLLCKCAPTVTVCVCVREWVSVKWSAQIRFNLKTFQMNPRVPTWLHRINPATGLRPAICKYPFALLNLVWKPICDFGSCSLRFKWICSSREFVRFKWITFRMNSIRPSPLFELIRTLAPFAANSNRVKVLTRPFSACL